MDPWSRSRTGLARRTLPAVAFAAYVLYASVIDPGGGAGAGEVANTMAATGPLGIFGPDKWLHAGTYATLAFLVAFALSAGTGRALLAAWLLAAAFGAGVEVVQYPLAARSADVLDALANAAGAALGVGVWVAVSTGVRRLRSTGHASRSRPRQ